MLNKIIVSKKESGSRLDRFLTDKLSVFSRSKISALINKGLVKTNKNLAKPGYIIKMGDSIEYAFPIKSKIAKLKPENIPLDIVYQDNDVIVLNKSAHMLVHPTDGNSSGTLVNALLYHYPDIKNAIYDENSDISRARPGIVQRLDKDTTGVMIVAKNKDSLYFLKNEIEKRKVGKKYLALCLDNFPEHNGEINNYINRHPKKRVEMSVLDLKKGKQAITKYKVLKTYSYRKHSLALVEFMILTGRTHQIRVHAKYLNSPVLGDPIYSTKVSEKLSKDLLINSPLLHSFSLTINLPNNGQKTYKAKMPDNFMHIINKLSKNKLNI